MKLEDSVISEADKKKIPRKRVCGCVKNVLLMSSVYRYYTAFVLCLPLNKLYTYVI
jgi:hypothetical protein